MSRMSKKFDPMVIDGGPVIRPFDSTEIIRAKEKAMTNECPSTLTKQQLVDRINNLPGPKVTTRPRKDTLLEIYEDRKMEVVAMTLEETDELTVGELWDDPKDEPTTWESVMKITSMIILFGMIILFMSYLVG